MAGRPAKRLIEHVHEATFRPSVHGELLATDPLPPEFAEFGERYRDAASARERQAVALEFRDAIAGGHAAGKAHEAAQARLDAILDAPPEVYDPPKLRAASERFYRVLYARDAHRFGMPADGSDAWVPLTVRQIAKRLGVSYSTVRRYLAEVTE